MCTPPALPGGLTTGQQLIAVDGREYDEDALKDAIVAAKGGNAPIKLIVKNDDRVREVPVVWNGGLRYPHLTKTGKGDGALDKLFAPK